MYFIRNMSRAHFKIACGSRWFYTSEGLIFNPGFKWFLLLWYKEDPLPLHGVTFGEFGVGLRWWRCCSSPRCGVRWLAPRPVPYGFRLFTPAVVTQSFQVSPPLLMLHSREVQQLSLITVPRSKIEKLIDWFVALVFVSSVVSFPQLLSGVTSRRCSRVFRSRWVWWSTATASIPLNTFQALTDKQCHLILFSWKTDSSF